MAFQIILQRYINIFIFLLFAGSLFRRMFPDSTIASNFQCGETKSSYLTVFGIAPYCKSLVMDRIKSAENGYILLFDESLNQKTQSKQMDIHVKFWDNDIVATRYFSSDFMGHSTADDMVEVFHKATEGLSYKNLVQLSMDGPNVNVKFHKLIQTEMENDLNTSLLNVGSCGLHILHGAFKKGADAAQWNLDQFLSSAYWLLKDSPARREDYAKAVGQTSPLMPLKFCKIRWVENVPVTDRMLKILPDMMTYVHAVEAGKFSKPAAKSYLTVKEGCTDPLMQAKLSFLLSFSKEVAPFLTRYQTDRPMIPFLGEDLFNLMSSIMSRFVKADVMANANTLTKLMSLDIADTKNLAHARKVDVGFCAEKLLKNLVSTKKISDRAELEFRNDCRKSLQTLAEKLQEKSPLHYSLVRNMDCLNPRRMAENSDACIAKLKRILKVMTEAKRFDENKCDDVVKQYRGFLRDVATRNSDFADFDSATGRVDTLLYSTMAGDKMYAQLWSVVAPLLLLSHGNASVERGFSINKQIEVENMKESTYSAQRLVCDHLRSVGGIDNFVVTKGLIKSASLARQRYIHHLDEQKKNKEKEKVHAKRKAVVDEIEELKRKKTRLEKDSASLQKSADEFAQKAEDLGDLTFIAKSNCLRQSAKLKSDEIKTVNEALVEKQKLLANI